MEKRGFQLYFRDLAKERLSSAELEKLIGNRDYKEFLNTPQRTLPAKKYEERIRRRARKPFG